MNKIKKPFEEDKERISEISNKPFMHQKCNSRDTQMSGCFSILAPCGDEEACALIFCKQCQRHFLDCFHDDFMGDKDFVYQQELSQKEVKIVNEAISKCENPDNKYCRCEYHKGLGEILYGSFLKFMKKAKSE